MIDVKALSSEFPHDAISWRAQSVTKDGTKAMALAYIDARDVMRRLDDVCGPNGWQCRYPHATTKTICEIGIKCGDEWIWKANGAGDTDIEAEKGAISDAFKRAAVLWGIGRYLYDMPSPWVPCESYDDRGKWKWKKWNDDPWNHVKGKVPQAPKNDETRKIFASLVANMKLCELPQDMDAWWKDVECKELRAKLPADWRDDLATAFKEHKQSLIEKATQS